MDAVWSEMTSTPTKTRNTWLLLIRYLLSMCIGVWVTTVLLTVAVFVFDLSLSVSVSIYVLMYSYECMHVSLDMSPV
jgi:hypothetical protein